MKILTKLVLFAIVCVFAYSCNNKWKIESPYEDIKWDECFLYKANLHTHTTCSDGKMNPHQVIDYYHNLNYSILAITDHDLFVYPWQNLKSFYPSNESIENKINNDKEMPSDFIFKNRNPIELEIIDIEGNELSRHHHICSYFNNHNGPKFEEDVDIEIPIEESIDEINKKNGIMIFNHPGRYDYTYSWYIDLFRQNKSIIGVEVYNQGDRYPNDRKLWDSILTNIIDIRQVWAYSNDDSHELSDIGKNWNILILPILSHKSVREAMENGKSFFVYSPKGHNTTNIPTINSISINKSKGIIGINAKNYSEIIWISEGKIIHKGSYINLNAIDNINKYVRAEIHGKDKSILGTQAFKISK